MITVDYFSIPGLIVKLERFEMSKITGCMQVK